MAPRSVDVLVIGAGVIGTAIALELAEAGAHVRVIEAGAPGSGASRASAGVLAPYLEGHHSPSLRELGRRSLDLFPRHVARVVARSGTKVLFERRGTLEVAYSASDVVRLKASRTALGRMKVAAEWLGATRVLAAEPRLAKDVRGGLLVPMHAAVDVPTLVAAQAQAARARGVSIASGVTASIVRNDGGRAAVHTSSGVMKAANVVLAAGTSSTGLEIPGADPLPVTPVRGQLLQLAAPKGTLGHVLWAPNVYLVPFKDGTVLVGATSEHVGHDDRNTVDGVAGLMAAATAVVPALGTATFKAAKSGLRPGSPDGLPFIGRASAVKALIYACGHYRNGVLLAPLTAKLVLDITRGVAPDEALRLVDPMRAGRL